MKKIHVHFLMLFIIGIFLLTGCGSIQIDTVQNSSVGQSSESPFSSESLSETEGSDEQLTAESGISDMKENQPGSATLLYQGQASIRIVTDEGMVIYIDPFSGDGYDLSADLILVTHPHFDHNQIEKVKNRNLGCQIITQNEAIQNGKHQVFELGYVTVEAVEAGFNRWHDVAECVGYVLTFSNGKSVYVTGDTSTTEQMPILAEKDIDYAFFCCDGVYNMDIQEAAECARMVGAKYNIPYHTTATTTGRPFDRAMAEQFEVENRLIVEDGEEIQIE